MSVRASVIVAVYNPGPAIDAVVDSVRAQTLGTGAVELILVDDGSTDGSGPRLQELAERESWVTYRRIENSGWPSRPRNLGVGMAAGDYVLFMDHDDLLYPQALEQMCAAGDRDTADIVVGKEVRTGGRTLGLDAFRSNKSGADMFADEVIDLATPHKLFRTSFLREHGIAFPEHLRRLEDHYILAASYGHRPRVSVVADQPCYRWMIHDTNNSVRLPDPHDYYGALDEVLDVVESWPLPDEAKRMARAFWLKSTVLDRFGPGGFRTWPEEFRPRFFAEALRITRERLEPELDTGLPPAHRVRAALLRAGDMDGLVAYSEGEAAVTTRPVLGSAAEEGGVLSLEVSTLLEGRGGPVRFRLEGARLLQEPSAPIPPEVAESALEVQDHLERARIDVILTERETNAEWFVPTTATHRLVRSGDALAWSVEARAHVDPRTALMGSALTAGIWDVRLRVAALGYDSRPKVRVGGAALPGPVAFDDLAARAYTTQGGRLALQVQRVPTTAAAPGRPPTAAPQRSLPTRAARRLARELRALTPGRTPGTKG